MNKSHTYLHVQVKLLESKAAFKKKINKKSTNLTKREKISQKSKENFSLSHLPHLPRKPQSVLMSEPFLKKRIVQKGICFFCHL